jgi:hypothetical protein
MRENGKMRPVETILQMEGGRERRKMEGVNLTQIYCEYFCKCHNVPPYNNNIMKKNLFKERTKVSCVP